MRGSAVKVEEEVELVLEMRDEMEVGRTAERPVVGVEEDAEDP